LPEFLGEVPDRPRQPAEQRLDRHDAKRKPRLPDPPMRTGNADLELAEQAQLLGDLVETIGVVERRLPVEPFGETAQQLQAVENPAVVQGLAELRQADPHLADLGHQPVDRLAAHPD
jgi:hypothetical protein